MHQFPQLPEQLLEHPEQPPEQLPEQPEQLPEQEPEHPEQPPEQLPEQPEQLPVHPPEQEPEQVVEHNPVHDAAHPVFDEDAVNGFDAYKVIFASNSVGVVTVLTSAPTFAEAITPLVLIALNGVAILL